MTRAEWEVFRPRSVDLFLRGIGVAIILCAVLDAWAGALRIHTGDIFPWRHLPVIPLFGRALLSLEWAFGGFAGLALLFGRKRSTAIGIGLVATAMGLSQRFSNHRALLFIVLLFVALDTPEPNEENFEARSRPNLALVRVQLLLVYAFSVLNKVLHGFLQGDVLNNLFGWPLPTARAIAWLVVIVEIAAPIALLKRPRAGIAIVFALHLGMAVLLPSVWPFSMTMLAMAFLFL